MNEKQIISAENKLFFRRFLKNPRQLGTVAPITKRFSDTVAKTTAPQHNQIVVEVGAGTGRLTRSLLNSGVQPKNLYAIELDKDLCDFMKKTIPQINIIHGDAKNVSSLLPQEIVENVDVVYSVIPLMYLEKNLREEIVNACFDVMKLNAAFYQVTYSCISPLKNSDLFTGTRIKSHWMNIPPGFVWSYQKKKAPE